MSVHHILSAKGHQVLTIEPHRTLSEAVRILAERRIGALLVTNGSRPVSGIISERDVVRAVSANGAQALDEPVSRFMTERVVTCTSRADVNELMETMTNGKFRHIPVVEDGRLVGIISIGDVVKHRLAEIEAEAQAIKDYIATA
ncbi:CBS domain-containing protein [Microvirga puerhi]|uniref:CBS domain-containing protein n=1 Tax=Microvirga puerhi TaxID=2876078 RepID=A0ABS7VJ21_9HYPH|nr:CBS domain-containing protein [Microvirga puerhi]MBZ6075494.1 CBS domain-containing protein [Microvirga puerhi]